MSDIVLVVTRLKDMRLMHPEQDNTRVCSSCGEAVGIYPSGVKMLSLNPMPIICSVCAANDARPGDELQTIGSAADIVREVRESVRRQ